MTATVAADTFTGFSREAIDFLTELAANNERSWFQPRKTAYERLLKEPLEALCLALDREFAARDIPLTADPGLSPFRIYRDVRFSKDKSPYKTHVSASFPWIGNRAAAGSGVGFGAEGRSGVGGYFHFQPGEIFVGGGMWHPQPARLSGWRQAVTTDPDRVHGAIDDEGFRREFGEVSGDRLKRVPTGFPPDHADAELLKLKDVAFGRRLSDEDAMSPALPATLAESFEAAVPLLGLLAALPTG